MHQVHPVVLCGGSGRRLWPLSTPRRPKPLLPGPEGEGTLLQQTLNRFRGPQFAPPRLVCGHGHHTAVRAGAPGCLAVVEPMPRGTAAAVVAAAVVVGEGLVLVSPADHSVARPEELVRAVMAATSYAATGHTVLFGVVPDRPATGFGWIELGEALEAGLRGVRKFVEKPDRRLASAMLDAGGHVWNAGLFLFEAAALLAEVERIAPALLDAVRAAVAGATTEGDALLLDAAAFARAPEGSFDVRILEKSQHLHVVPVDMGWDDVGNWDSVARASSVASRGPVVSRDAPGCLVWSDGPPVVAVGIRDVVVVAGAEGVAVLGRGHAEQVGVLADELRELPAVRPWGRYAVLDSGPGFQVKRLLVAPGHRTSLQRHDHREEQWTVVSGRGVAIVGEAHHELITGGSVRVPAGADHRLCNDSDDELVVIEVQTGSYLGEDDIYRHEDDYGRALAGASGLAVASGEGHG